MRGETNSFTILKSSVILGIVEKDKRDGLEDKNPPVIDGDTNISALEHVQQVNAVRPELHFTHAESVAQCLLGMIEARHLGESKRMRGIIMETVCKSLIRVAEFVALADRRSSFMKLYKELKRDVEILIVVVSDLPKAVSIQLVMDALSGKEDDDDIHNPKLRHLYYPHVRPCPIGFIIDSREAFAKRLFGQQISRALFRILFGYFF